MSYCDLFDVVIPVGPNDIAMFYTQLQYTKQNVIGRRKIYIVTSIVLDPERTAGCELVAESIFPFSLESVGEYISVPARRGWYLQQLLKLYAGQVIPDILPRYLVIDSDTCFLKPTTFVSEDGVRAYFATGDEHHAPYFEHMARLDPAFRRVHPALSGICHHMLFEKTYVKELFERVETACGRDGHTPFWVLFLQCVDPAWHEQSGASEYELYFNYMQDMHPDVMQIRPLHWANLPTLPAVSRRRRNRYDYVSCHYYIRPAGGAAGL
jgi:hypothetical protein